MGGAEEFSPYDFLGEMLDAQIVLFSLTSKEFGFCGPKEGPAMWLIQTIDINVEVGQAGVQLCCILFVRVSVSMYTFTRYS